jgi:hypothetical protein
VIGSPTTGAAVRASGVAPIAHPEASIPTSGSDEREQYVRGTLAGALLVGATGALACLAAGRVEWALAFAVGAAIPIANLRLIGAAVERLAAAPGGARRMWRGALFRFALAGLALVAALVVFRLAPLPLVAGLLLAQAWIIGQWLWYSLRAL